MLLEGFLRFPLQLLFLVALAVTSWAWGEAVLRHLFPGDPVGPDAPEPPPEDEAGPGPLPDDAVHPAAHRWAFSAALGLGMVGQGLFFLGLIHELEPRPMAAFFVVGHVVAAAAGAWRGIGRLVGSISGQCTVLVLATLPAFAIAFYPPMGFDATVYHLPFAERFLETGRLAFLHELRFPVFPQLGELVFVPGMLWAGDEAAQLTQALAFFFGAGVVWAWGRWRGDFAVAYLATALWVGLPLSVWIGGQAYVDLSLALFVTAAAAAWDRWRLEEVEEASEAKRPVGWLFLAGVFLGCAAATKYLGLFFVGALGVLTARARWRRLAPLLAGVLLVALPWYARTVWLTGNPVFPFYTSVFGANEWSTMHDATLDDAAEGGLVADVGARVLGGLDDLALLPYDALFRRHLYDLEAPLSPWYLLLVPLALYAPFARRRRPVVRRWLAVVLVFGLFWLTTMRELRFWIPALSLFHLAVALALADLLERHVTAERRRWSLLLLAGVVFVVPGWLYGFHKLSELGMPPLDAAQRVSYLDARIPGHDLISQMEREHLDQYGVYALHGERLRHYADGRFRGDWFGPDRFARFRPLLQDPDRLAAALEARHLDHLLVNRLPGVVLDDVEASDRFEKVMESDGHVLYHVIPDDDVAAPAAEAGASVAPLRRERRR